MKVQTRLYLQFSEADSQLGNLLEAIRLARVCFRPLDIGWLCDKSLES
jgi:hypothetical protein